MGENGKTMNCRELVNDFLADYLSDELPAEARRAFVEHLAVCPNCVNYLESYKRTIELEKRAFADDGEKALTVPEELVKAILHARSQSNK